MTRPRHACFWVLLFLGTMQSTLGASVLFDSQWTWWLAAGSYMLWLSYLARRSSITSRRLVVRGYLAPILLYAVVYASCAMSARSETREARELLQSKRTLPATQVASDVPAPKLTATQDNQDLTRGVWLLISTFFYLVACAVCGLLWHTPIVVYLFALAVAACLFRFPGSSS